MKEPVLVNGEAVRYDLCPNNLRGTMERYLEHGISGGHFFTSFLSNDLMGALGRADQTNLHQFPEIGKWLYNYAPSQCYGSPDKVKEWMESRRSVATTENP